jgi:hypothetical protein
MNKSKKKKLEMKKKPVKPPGHKGPTVFDEDAFFLFNLGSRFRELKASHKTGNPAALFDAVLLCEESGTVPDWVFKAVLVMLSKQLRLSAPNNKGRGGNKLGRPKDPLLHFRRWDCVRRLKKESEISDTEAFRRASKQLRGEFGRGSARQIGDSCKAVELDMRDPKKRPQNYPPRVKARIRMGIQRRGRPCRDPTTFKSLILPS